MTQAIGERYAPNSPTSTRRHMPRVASQARATSGTEAAKVAQCKQTLRPTSNPDLTYRDRCGRCEGLFTQPIAASAQLEIVG